MHPYDPLTQSCRKDKDILRPLFGHGCKIEIRGPAGNGGCRTHNNDEEMDDDAREIAAA
jgi:hypothetical protein